MTNLQQEKQNRITLASNKQLQASDPNISAWVEASAGTGKTKVLSDRVLRMLLNGATPHKILCLTYTKAAAVEMNNRIAARLSKWAVASEEELEKELSKLLGRSLNSSDLELKKTARKLFAVLLDTPGGMKIQTIHSFCQEILKRFPLEAHISPYFEVMDERRAQEILDELKKKLLQKIKEEPDSQSAQALSYLTSHTTEYTFPDILNAITFSRAKITRLFEKFASLQDLLSATAQSLSLHSSTKEKDIFLEFFSKLNTKMLQSWVSNLEHGSKTDKDKSFIIQKTILDNNDFEAYKNIFLTKENEIRKNIFTQSFFKNKDTYEKEVLTEAIRVKETSDLLSKARLLESTTAVLYLAQELISSYNQHKQNHSLMDYEDLILLTRKLLENPGAANWVLYKLDGGIDNILIDEAQDTSPEQWAIIRAITADFFTQEGFQNPRTIFVVGDRKQSIYSFQGADPQEFEYMRQYFKKQTPANNPLKEVQMDVSFRSCGAVLDLVNHLFSRPEVKRGVAREDVDLTHSPARIGESGKIEIWPIFAPEENENPDIWQPPVERISGITTSSRLAKEIATKIRQMVTNHEILISQNRPIQYKDFLILVQRRNHFVEELVRACKIIGVEVAGVDKIRLLEQIAIQDLISLGKFLLLPEDDLNLACLLKSPIFGHNDDDLFKLCYNQKHKNLWQKLQQSEQHQNTCIILKELLNMTDNIRPFELYSYVLNQLEGRKKFISRMGYEVTDGLDEFINLTISFEQEHIPTLQKFIQWIEGDEVEIKRELEQSDINAVRIMTVHGSKGLQAPIVILPDTVRIKTPKKEGGLLLDELLYYPLSSEYYEEHCNKIKEKEGILSSEEYRRLLYVALTRAEDRLCICGYQGTLSPKEDCWYNLCEKSLSQIGEVKENKTICYETLQQCELSASAPAKAPIEPLSLPAWINKNAPEFSPLQKPLTPSKLDDEDNENVLSPLFTENTNPYRRGIIMHKLLQFLPETASKEYSTIIQKYLEHNATDISDRDKKYIKEKILSLLNDKHFKRLFSANSKAEVPLMGEVDGKIISGQIDRLIVEDDTVLIIDFKTNRPAAKTQSEIPSAYLKQMAAYKVLLQRIYPQKQINCGILWTDTAQFMLVD